MKNNSEDRKFLEALARQINPGIPADLSDYEVSVGMSNRGEWAAVTRLGLKECGYTGDRPPIVGIEAVSSGDEELSVTDYE